MRVFIQNEAGSRVKNSHHEKTLGWLSAAQVSRSYPFPYGFILNTTAEDGDNVDCFVLTKAPLETGHIVECEALALMEQIEDGQVDHNVLAVMPGEEAQLDDRARQLLIEFVSHVFDHIPAKKIAPGSFRSRETALDYICKHKDSMPAAG